MLKFNTMLVASRIASDWHCQALCFGANLLGDISLRHHIWASTGSTASDLTIPDHIQFACGLGDVCVYEVNAWDFNNAQQLCRLAGKFRPVNDIALAVAALDEA